MLRLARKQSVAEECRRAIFAVLHDQALRPSGQNLLRRTHQVTILGQQLGFAIVDQQTI